MTIPATGQFSIFDVTPDEQQKKKPCEYSFKRYIGQPVVLPSVYFPNSREYGCVHGTIHRIEPYYTIVKADGCYYVGTPTTMQTEE